MQQTEENSDVDEEYHKEPRKKKEKKKLFEKKNLMIFGVIIILIVVVLLFLLGLGSGVDSVNIRNARPTGEGLEVIVTAQSSGPLGGEPSGNGKLFIDTPDGETEEFSIKFSKGEYKEIIDFKDFFTDNGEYEVKVSFEGKNSNVIPVELSKLPKVLHVTASANNATKELNVFFDMLESEDSSVNVKAIGNGNFTILYKENNTNESDPYQGVYEGTYKIEYPEYTIGSGTNQTFTNTFEAVIKYNDFLQEGENDKYLVYMEFTSSIGKNPETVKGIIDVNEPIILSSE